MKLALIFLLVLAGASLAIADLLLSANAMEPALVTHPAELRRLPSIDHAAVSITPTPTGNVPWALPAAWKQPSENTAPIGEAEEIPLPGPSFMEPVPLNQLGDRPEIGDSDVQLPFELTNSLPGQFSVDALVRAYYINDQRVEWSGMEMTFGAEAAVRPQYQYQCGDWIGNVVGDIYLNQPFDRNMYVNSPERQSYLNNFEPDLFQLSNLYLSWEKENWYFSAGKIETPFGRTYFPLYSNSRIDAPFIRTEAIRWRETGLLARYRRNSFVGDVALTNGGVDQDTNSSKALITRLGFDFENAAFGFSYKTQDGIGSETQKTYNNQIGVDFMVQHGRFRLSGEAIYDEYGFRRPGYNPDDIFWEHSIYYRDVNKAPYTPCQGFGYYVNLDYVGERWKTTLNYGEYYPDQLGLPQHDQINRRGLIKGAYRINQVMQSYTAAIIENGGYVAQDNRKRIGFMILTGFQANF